MAALALGISALGLACSSGGSTPTALKATGAGQSAAGSPATSGSSGDPTGSGSTASPSTAAPAASNPTTPATAAPATTHVTTPATTPVSATTQPTTKPTTPAATSTGPQPTSPGTYKFNGSGTTTIEGSTGGPQSFPAATETDLTISGGGGSEQWTNSVTTENLTFNGSGVFLTSETLNSGTGASGTSCVFATPVAYPPWPLSVGKSSSGTANCGSGTLSISVEVVSQSGANFVVKVTQTSGSLKVIETDTYSPSMRMPVATSFVITGAYGTTAVSTQSSYTLS